MNRFFAGAALAAAAVAFAGAASAATPLWEWTATGESFTNGAWDFSQVFTANETLTVSALGYYDASLEDGAGAFTGDHAVALYDSSGDLLASATVDSSDSASGHFRYASIDAVTLTAGQTYVLDGDSGADNYAYSDTGWAASPNITYVGYNYVSGGGDSFNGTGTTDLEIGDAFWGPNALASAVPEPATWAMLLLGFVGLGAMLRRKPQRLAASVA